MKTILNILIILFVAAVIARGFTLIVNNTASTSGPGGEGGQPPAMTSADGQTMQPPSHSEVSPGGEDNGGASLGMGLLKILVTLAKLTGITLVVLFVEKAISLLSKKRIASLV
jgi:hypothetical protein